MIKEFEGRTEKEAIDKAVEELKLERDCFDVEIIETQRGGLFKKPYVKIRVHTSAGSEMYSTKYEKRHDEYTTGAPAKKSNAESSGGMPLPADPEFENSIIEYLEKIISLMGMDGKSSIIFREKRKLCVNISSQESSLIIGKKGKTLDALQAITTVHAAHLGHEHIRIILDCENYRVRREESLVRLAYNVAGRIRENRSSILLEPMNPFDRRIIHTTISDIDSVETKSEGQGLYKQVRVFYKGSGMPRSKRS
jgi:spoIIIJ-associated protein